MTSPNDRIARLQRDCRAARENLIEWAFAGDLDDAYAAERGRNLAGRVVRTHETLGDALAFRHAARALASRGGMP